MPQGTRWNLDGYYLNGVWNANVSSFVLVMDKNYNATWQWRQEVNLTLTSNYGSPTLTGGGWIPVGGQKEISAEQIFFIANVQYIFMKWLVQTGNASMTNPNSPTTTVTINNVPTIQAVYQIVNASMTNTYTTTITTIISGSTVTTTSTGIFSHNQVTVQLQIQDSSMNPSLLANANVTVLDDAGQRVWRGLTDQSGFTAQFQVNPTLIYTVQVQYLGRNYATRQQFTTTGTYPVDIAGSNPLISLQAVAPWIIPILVISIVVIALIYYLSSRRGPSKPHVEWVSR